MSPDDKERKPKYTAVYERMTAEEFQQLSQPNQMEAFYEYAKKRGFIVSKKISDDEKGEGKA